MDERMDGTRSRGRRASIARAGAWLALGAAAWLAMGGPALAQVAADLGADADASGARSATVGNAGDAGTASVAASETDGNATGALPPAVRPRFVLPGTGGRAARAAHTGGGPRPPAPRVLGATVAAAGLGAVMDAAMAAAAERAAVPANEVIEHARRTATRPAPDGEANGSDGTRIFGGQRADRGEYPYQVSLVFLPYVTDSRDSRWSAQSCGGSIIHRQWILTAAHCVVGDDGQPFDPSVLGVEVGMNRLGEGELRGVGRVVVHEQYDPRTLDHDIALLRLAAPLDNAGVPVAAVPVVGQGREITEGAATVTGWGRTRDSKRPYDMMEVEVSLIDRATCDQGFGQMAAAELGAFLTHLSFVGGMDYDRAVAAYEELVPNLSGYITDIHLCAGDPRGERDSCTGDSGGPLTVHDADGNALQVGIVSFGYTPMTQKAVRIPLCGIPQVYGVYTNLSNYFDWIARHVRAG